MNRKEGGAGVFLHGLFRMRREWFATMLDCYVRIYPLIYNHDNYDSNSRKERDDANRLPLGLLNYYLFGSTFRRHD